jgi:hypothetical protein
MSSSGPEARLDVGGVALRLALPEGAREEPASALPVLDVSRLSGARVTASRGFRAPVGEGARGELLVRAACVRAPSDGWAPGLEDLVLERATAIAARSVEAADLRWIAAPVAREGELVAQSLAAEGRASGAMRHFLGFAGEAPDAWVCSVACLEPSPGDRCGALVRAAIAEGTLAPEPAPNLTVRAILLAAEHPGAAGGLVVAAIMGAVALLLARRPRPRP